MADEKGDGPYVDPEEQELLQRYRHDNPSFLCFRDTDDRPRMLEERFAECELEKQVKAVHELLHKRRHEMTKDHRLQRLPLHPTVPSTKELRDLRTKMIDPYEKVVEKQDATMLADILAKEVALSEESREGLPTTLTTLIDFYKNRSEMLPRRQLRYLQRWMANCNSGEQQAALQPTFLSSRVEKLTGEIQYTQNALEQLEAYFSKVKLNNKADNRAHRASKVGNATAETEGVFEANTVEIQDLDPNYIRTYLKAQSYEFRSRKRFERFASKCNFMPLSHRYQLYSEVTEHLIGGGVAEGVERSDFVPTMVLDEEGVIAKLDDVAGCFKLAGHDKTDVQEFTYNVNKRYAAVFAAQSASLVFHSAEAAAAAITTTGKPAPREVIDDTTEKVMLRQAKWKDSCTISTSTPAWQQKQDTLIAAVVGQVDAQLEAEMSFLAEVDATKTTQRWRSKTDTHEERATVRQRMDRVDMGALRSDFSAEQAQQGLGLGGKRKDPRTQGAHHQRLLALYQLRFIRIRSFRRRLLAILNYFASAYRSIALDCKPRSMAHAATGVNVDAKPLYPDASIAAEKVATAPSVAVSDPVAAAPTTTFANKLLSMYDSVEESVKIPNTAASGDAATNDAAADTAAAKKDTMAAAPPASSITEWCALNAPDTYEAATANTPIAVRDPAGRLIMDEWALEQLDKVEHQMLRTASYYVSKYGEVYHKDIEAMEVDHEVVIEDIYESELLFWEGKMKVLDSYREAYEHAVDRREQTKLGKIMLELIEERPRLDLTDYYFTASYTHDIIRLELQHTLLREILNSQVQEERKIIASWPMPPAHAAASSIGLPEDIPALNPADWYGGPEAAIADTRLFAALFPNTSVINVMDIYSSTPVVADLPVLVDRIMSTIMNRFQITHASGIHRLQRHVLQEMLVQWRLLGEEEKVARQLQQTNGEDIEAQGALNSIATIDAVVNDICSEENASKGKKADDRNVSSHQSLSSASTAAAELAADNSLPVPSLLFTKLSRVMDVYAIRAALTKALFETEVLYNIHRQQAKTMGVSVKRSQLDPIDFETRRTYAEIDDADNIRDMNGEQGDPMEEVLSIKAELLTNLAIAEFEQAMARFDLSTNNGVRKLLTHMTGDFRRALTAQITQKNVLVAVTLCNQVPIDLYFESLMYQRWSTAGKGNSFVTQQQQTTNMSPDGVAHVRRRLDQWPGLRDPSEFVDRPSMQKLYISVNQIKSIHRKCILMEMNSRTSDVLTAKKPELLRRKMKELKAELVHEYCRNMVLATYQYAAKYQACCLAHNLRVLNSAHPHLNFFTMGNRNDVVRPQPRSGAVAGEARRVATCMLTRNGKLDDARYVPHVLQILQLDFDSKATGSAAKDGIKQHEHQHYHNQSHLRTNHCLSMIVKLLHHWTGVVTLLRCIAYTGTNSYQAITHPSALMDSWRDPLLKTNNDLESLPDVTDASAVSEYLETRHAALFMSIGCALHSLKSHYYRVNITSSAEAASKELQRLIGCADCSTVANARHQYLLWPSVSTYQEATALRTTENKMESSPFFGPLGRIKTMSVGADFDASITEAENTPAGAVPLGPNENYFYEEVDRNNCYFVGDEWGGLYPHIDSFMLAATSDERKQFVTEMGRIDQVMEDTNEDTYESFGRDGVQNGTMHTKLTPLHLELLQCTLKREQLKLLYSVLLRQSFSAKGSSLRGFRGISNQSNSEHSLEAHVEELFQRTIIHRAKSLAEKEQTDRNDNRYRRRGRGQERDLRRRQVQILTMEINKLLIQQQMPRLESIRSDLETAATEMETHTPQTNTVLPQKTAIFTDFISILMSRALCTRNEGDKSSTYHIPEASINSAIDMVGRKIEAYGAEERITMANAADSLLQQYQRRIVALEHRCHHQEFLRSVDERALSRRVQANIADAKFDLLFANDMLQKDVSALQRQLSHVQETIRNDVRVEFDGRIAELKRELMLSQGQYASYKKKLHRDMQVSLEEIKRVAMLSVGKMENAPLHMKRQALKIAISDDELNTLKEQNGELKQAVVKTKLWYEMKLLRMKAAFDKQLKEATSAVDATRTKFWGSKELTEKETLALKEQLSSTQNLLSQAELEVELLRKDLQLQLTNKKDLVAWKVQQAKAMEELQKKVKRYERWGQYDIDRLLNEHERRMANGGDGQPSAGNTSARGARSSSAHGRPGTGASERAGTATDGVDALTAKNLADEIKRLQERLDKEKRLKEKAFAKVDELRQGDPATNEALVWQRKYFEAASELQRCIKELEVARSHMAQQGVNPPPTATSQSLLRPFHSAGPSPASTGAIPSSPSPAGGGSVRATPELGRSSATGSRPGTTATPMRPPPSRLGSEASKRGKVPLRSSSATGLKK